MRKEELLAQYEVTGDPAVFEAARRLYEEAVAADPANARDRFEYAYLLECRGRELLREAVAHYERVVAGDDAWPKAHLQLIFARAALTTSAAQAIAERARLNPKYPAGSHPNQQSLFSSITEPDGCSDARL